MYEPTPARPARASRVRRHALQVSVGGSVAAVLWALLLAMTGWGFLNWVGPATITVALLAFLVAAAAGACELGPKIATRHRTAVREARR